MKTQGNVRQDLMRGVRWGAILLLAALLSIAAFRVFSSNPAEGAPAPAVVVTPPAETPALAVEPAPGAPVEAAPVIQVAQPVAAAVAEQPAPRPKAATPARSAEVKEVPAPQRLSAPKYFVASPAAGVPPPPPKSSSPVVSTSLPEANALVDAPGVSLPSSTSLAPPPSADDDKQSRAGKVVRSVGRLFRLGRKDDGKQGDGKQK